MKKKVLVVLANGFEEIEAVTPIDILRRAGLEVTVAGIGGKNIKGSHGIVLQADTTLAQYQDVPDAIVLPGGLPGANHLRRSKVLSALLLKMKSSGKWIGAICASPARVLAPMGILDGKEATCYPGFEKEFEGRATFTEERVVTDGRVITSRGPGTALEFSIELVRRLVDNQTADSLIQATLARV